MQMSHRGASGTAAAEPAAFAPALAVARARSRGSGRELSAGWRSADWGCYRLCQPFSYFLSIAVCGGGLNYCLPFVVVFGVAAAIIGTALWLPFCASRRHESKSFAVVVTEGVVVQVEDFVGCSCPPFESENFAVVVTEGHAEDFTGCWKEEERAILVIKTRDIARTREHCYGVDVFLKDPETGATRVVKGDCCVSDSEAPPDHTWKCVQDPGRLVDALRGAARAARRDESLAAMQAVARSGAAKPLQAQANVVSL